MLAQPHPSEPDGPDLPCRQAIRPFARPFLWHQPTVALPSHCFLPARRSPRNSCMQARCFVLGDQTPDAFTSILMVNFKSTVAVEEAAAPAYRQAAKPRPPAWLGGGATTGTSSRSGPELWVGRGSREAGA
jgi:hypothetical protein